MTRSRERGVGREREREREELGGSNRDVKLMWVGGGWAGTDLFNFNASM